MDLGSERNHPTLAVIEKALSADFHLEVVETTTDSVCRVPLAEPEFSGAQLMLATRRGRVLPPSAAAFCENLRALLKETVSL